MSSLDRTYRELSEKVLEKGTVADTHLLTFTFTTLLQSTHSKHGKLNGNLNGLPPVPLPQGGPSDSTHPAAPIRYTSFQMELMECLRMGITRPPPQVS